MGVTRHCPTRPNPKKDQNTMFSSFFLAFCSFTLSSLFLLSSAEPCPDPFVTIYNKACSNDCAQNGEEYLWCRMRDGEWDYCSEDYRLTRYGEACVDGCSRRGELYYWCNKVVGGWDYCSPRCDGIHTR